MNAKKGLDPEWMKQMQSLGPLHSRFMEYKPEYSNRCDFITSAACQCATVGLTGLACMPFRAGYCGPCMRCCGCTCPFGGTLLFWAIYYNDFPALQNLVGVKANLNAKLPIYGETPIAYARKFGAPEEMITYLEHSANAAPISENMDRGVVRVAQVMGLKHKKYAFFLSHHKRDAAAIASTMRTKIAVRMNINPAYVFLDSEALRDLHTLRDQVKNSLVLVVILTKDILTRPWCLVEIFTAIENQVPIAAVKVEGQGNQYDYQASAEFLQSDDFSNKLEEASPGAIEELTKQQIDIPKMAKAIGSILPYIIASPYNVSASEHVRDAQLDDILDVLIEKV